MKILHVLSQYPDSTGSGIYLQAMLREAAQRGYSNGLLAAVNATREPVLDQKLLICSRLLRFQVSPLNFDLPGMSDVMPYPSTRFKELSESQLKMYQDVFLGEFDKLIDDFSPDVIHSHHLWLLSSFIKLQYPHIPMLTSCHGSDLRQFKLCPHLRNKVLDGCQKIERVLALTRTQQDEIMNLYGIPRKQIAIAGIGFENSLFYSSSKPNPPPVQITYCGKLSRSKGVPWLLKALAKSKMKDYHLHLIGEGSGEERDECYDLSRSLGKKVTFLGALQQDALAAHLRKTHIFVLPSFYEGLPLVVLEALACGCRVIATKLPGCLEIYDQVGSDLIHLVDLPRLHHIDNPYPEDEEVFIDNLQLALEKAGEMWRYQLAPDKESIAKKVQGFTWEKVFSRIEKNYVELVS